MIKMWLELSLCRFAHLKLFTYITMNIILYYTFRIFVSTSRFLLVQANAFKFSLQQSNRYKKLTNCIYILEYYIFLLHNIQ